MPRWLLPVLAGAAVAAVLAVAIDAGFRKPVTCGTSTAGEADIGGNLPPVDHTGRRRDPGPLGESPLLVYFGYTFCPDICPIDMLRMTRAAYALDDIGIDVTPVFVTIDPERDHPEMLAEFVEGLHPRTIGLTGNAGEIAEAAEDWRIYYRRGEGADDFYLMDHSTITYLASPDGQYQAHFTRDATAESIVETVSCLRNTRRI